MPLDLDPVFIDPLATGGGTAPPLIVARGDALGLRAILDPLLVEAFAASEPAPDVSSRDVSTPARDGTEIVMRWYTAPRAGPGSDPTAAAVFLHGGGLIAGSVDIYDPFVRQHVQWSGVPMLSVEYRLAPEATGETPARDSFAALLWLLEHAAELGVDPARIAVMGDSGGGGIAAAVAILARDEGIDLAAQILVFPMLDDRTTSPDPHLAGVATWTHDDNATGWLALLGEQLGDPDVSPYAAPARLQDFSGLARAYIEVGALDIFRDECIDYAHRLLSAGVQTELHVHPGAPHGYDTMAIGTPFAARWKADRVRVLTSL